MIVWPSHSSSRHPCHRPSGLPCRGPWEGWEVASANCSRPPATTSCRSPGPLGSMWYPANVGAARPRFVPIRRACGRPRRRPQPANSPTRSSRRPRVFERRRYQAHPPRYDYRLTAAGREVVPILMAWTAGGRSVGRPERRLSNPVPPCLRHCRRTGNHVPGVQRPVDTGFRDTTARARSQIGRRYPPHRRAAALAGVTAGWTF